jgi:uncharacterized integral membrane protein (TIGR00698 family)
MTKPQLSSDPPSGLFHLTAGIAASACVALASVLGEQVIAKFYAQTLPAAVLALVMGIFLHALTHRPVFQAGLDFCAKKLLQLAIALLGLRIVFDDIIGLGLQTLLIVTMAMVLTILCGIALVRLLGRSEAYGALAGGATAVCGASAALAIATVLPEKDRSDADTAFVVLSCNLLATLAMIAYPPLAVWLHFDAQQTGIFLGGSIHDVAQVVGAGLAVSASVAGLATIVKIYRVFLLLPVVLLIGVYLRGHEAGEGPKAKVPVPYFAFAFLALAGLNSFGLVPDGVRMILLELSRWGLLVAIAALGLKTSLAALAALGVRHMVVMVVLMAVIGCAVLLPILAFSSP